MLRTEFLVQIFFNVSDQIEKREVGYFFWENIDGEECQTDGQANPKSLNTSNGD